MIDHINTVKALEGHVARLQKQHAEIYQMLYRRGIRAKSVTVGLRRYFRKVEKARALLK